MSYYATFDALITLSRDVDMEAYAERVNEPYWKFCQWDLPKEKNIY